MRAHAALLPALLLVTDVAAAADPEIDVTVDPRIELLAAVQVLAEYDFTRLITRHDFPYKADLKEHFTPHGGHGAVTMFSEMAQGGFTFDAPVSMVLHLTPPPALEPIAPFDETTVRRAGGEQRLHEFLALLRDFATASDFGGFFERHGPFYGQITEAVRAQTAGLDAGMLEEYYGTRQRSYTIILAPLFHPGGFGPRVQHADGSFDIYGVIGPHGVDGDLPTFGDADEFRYLVWHEFSHSFVNPIVDAFGEEVDEHSELFNPIRIRMERQAYRDWRTCVYEHVVRAVTCRFTIREQGNDAGLKALHEEQQRGFIYVPGLCGQLAHYEQQRDQYPTLADYFPALLDVFEKASSSQLRMAAAPAPQVVRTAPANGEQGVDPAVTEIVVEFDRDMQPDGYSFVQRDDETFPETTGKPSWRSPRVCVLPVKLEAGRSYWIGLNTGRFTGFRGQTGEPSAPMVLEFTTAP